MDGISLLVPSVPMAKVALKRTGVVQRWANMVLKPLKNKGRCC